MLHDQRIFFSDNGSLTDVTKELNDFRSGSFAMSYTTGEDYLYIGSDWPFNSKFFEITGTANAITAAASVEYWGGENDGWKSALDILDFSDSGGASLAQSGHITWKRDRDEAWVLQDKSEEIPELSLITGIYRFFWLRISWDQSFTATLAHVGNKFSSDDELYSIYPDLSNAGLKTQWEAGKTDWNEQTYVAAEEIVRDLKSGGIIHSASQLLDFELFRNPSIHKTAELIYTGMGKAYAEDRNAARDRYKESIDRKNFRVDLNRDANLSRGEKQVSTVFSRR